MKTILRTATLVVWAVAAFGQEELKSWVPTNWGDTRIYQHESGKERWKTEETIEKPISVPEGTIVIRGIRTFDGKPPSPEAKKEAWLIHGDCLYDLTPGDWDSRHPDQLSAEFRAHLPWQGGEHVGVICFPLAEGKTWGKESGHEWRVAGVTEHDPASLDQGWTYHLSSYIGSGLTEDIWFERGAGIVKEDDAHNGEQTHTQLLFFGPAPARPLGMLPAPLGEIGVQYSYNALSISENGESNQSGGSAYGHYFLPKTGGSFGIVAEVTGSASNSGSLYTFLAGPSLTHEWRRAHLIWDLDLLVGGAHARLNGIGAAGSQVSLKQGSFVYGVGYGLQYRAGDQFVVTLFRIEPLSLELPDLVSGASHWQSDFRASAGVGFRFGEK